MKIGLVGWGIETQSAYNYFGSSHSYLIVNEHPRDDFPASSEKITLQYLPSDKPPGVTSNVEDLSYLEGLQDCDLIIYTPTSYRNLIKTFGQDHGFWDKTTTTRHIFFEKSPTKNLIGITGTKGKGTTSTLVHKMLETSGKKSYLLGNIGKGVLDVIHELNPDDWVVLELTSFQLQHFPYSPHIAVTLMIVPEHLDYHANMNEYVEAKGNLFAHQTEKDIAIYFDLNDYSRRIASYSKGRRVPYYKEPGAYVRNDGMIVIGENDTEIMHKSEVKLLGEHNLQNICAAITAFWQVSQDIEAIRKVISTFTGLEHRLEFVRELDGVRYYDDSFGTTPDTAIVAMRAFSEPKVMILGGSDKGTPFDSLAEAVVDSNVRHAIIIGDTAPKIVSLLKDRGYTHITEGVSNMPEIVKDAKDKSQEGDVVLLSAGCASFGLFKDYKDRGNQFKSAVMAL